MSKIALMSRALLLRDKKPGPWHYDAMSGGDRMDKTRGQLKDWIGYLCARHDVKATEVALKAGKAASTINRFLREDNAPLLNTNTINAIESAFGESFSAFISGEDKARNETEKRALRLLRSTPAGFEEKILELLEAAARTANK